MSESLFYDPAVLRVIRAILVSKGIRRTQELEDAIADVVLLCIEYVRKTGRPPRDVPEAIAIARPIAQGYGVDQVRKRIHHSPIDVGPTDQADEHAGEARGSVHALHLEQIFAVVREPMKDDEIEALADVAAGTRWKELAAEQGTSEAVLRKRMQRARDKARSALVAKGYLVAGGTFAALLLGAIALHFGPWKAPEIVSHPPPHEDPFKLAADLRRLAADACKERKWDECEAALDRAAKLDAQGDRAPEVATLRAAIAQGRRQGGEGP